MTQYKLSGLYAIADTHLLGDCLLPSVEAALQGGATLIQYRDKSKHAIKRQQQATELQILCNRYHATLIINDDIELASTVRAAGVHLGESDADYTEARARLGDDAIIGISCYNQLARAKRAAALGADYIAFGSVFPSASKPNAVHAPLTLFQEALSFDVPLCAIGGINASNAKLIVDAGADMIAVIQGLFNKPNIQGAAQQLSSLFETATAK